MDKFKLIGWIGLLVILVAGNTAVRADILDVGISAKSRGVGGAYIGDRCDAANGIFGNPAILDTVHTAEVVSMYSDLTGDVATTLLGFTIPVKNGEFGLGYAGNDSYGLWVTTSDASGRIVPESQFNYINHLFVLSYGRAFSKKLSLGARVKYLQQGTSGVAKAMGYGMNLDLGAIMAFGDNLDIGLVMPNIIIGRNGAINWDNGTSEDMPTGLLLGFEYRTPKFHYVGDYHYKTDVARKLRFGLEYELSEIIELRGGFEQAVSPGNNYYDLTAGVGFAYHNMFLDYAYYYDGLLPYNSRHYVSLRLALPQFNNN